MKYLAVTYTIVSGEFEFGGNTIVNVGDDKTEEQAVDAYFREYSELEEAEPNWYLYCGGEFAIKKINWHEITEADKKVLNNAGVY